MLTHSGLDGWVSSWLALGCLFQLLQLPGCAVPCQDFGLQCLGCLDGLEGSNHARQPASWGLQKLQHVIAALRMFLGEGGCHDGR